MAIERINIRNLRNITRAQLDFHPKLNLIYGANASGKTSLLEAMYLVTTGKSFRSNQQDHLVQHEQATLAIDIGIKENQRNSDISLRQGNGKRQIVINGVEHVRLAELARQQPVLFISPEGHHDFLQDAQLRRHTIDWLVFHVEPEFHGLWSKYRRLLRQRNAALKGRSSKAATVVWDQDLVATAEQIDHYRRQQIPLWQDLLNDYTQGFRSPDIVTLRYLSGWDQQAGLAAVLQQNYDNDLAHGYTGSGPHRADLQLMIGRDRMQHLASYGQQKLIVTALRLAQLAMFKNSSEQDCVILLDDLAAELDHEFQDHLLQIIKRLDLQTFVTATDVGLLQGFDWPPHLLFHVEQGQIEALRDLAQRP